VRVGDPPIIITDHYDSDTLHQAVVVMQTRLHNTAPSPHLPGLGLGHNFAATMSLQPLWEFKHW